MIRNFTVPSARPLEEEEELWVAVLLDAIDAFKFSRSKTVRIETEYFLFHDNNWFPVVCGFAGVDPTATREMLLCGVSRHALPPISEPLPALHTRKGYAPLRGHTRNAAHASRLEV